MFQDCTWHLKVGEPPLDLMCCSLLDGLPTNLSGVDAVMNMVGMLDSSKVCLGNDDKKFETISDSHQGIFKDKSGKLIYVAILMCVFTAIVSTHFRSSCGSS